MKGPLRHYRKFLRANGYPIPADDREFEFTLVNARGYRIEWLERKLTDSD